MSGRSTPWVAGTVVVSLLLVVAAWFTVIGPTLDDTAQAVSDTEAAETRNTQLATQLVALKKQYEHLDEYKADLAELQKQIPTAAQLADYTRQLSAIAEESGASVLTVTPGTAQAVVPEIPVSAAEPSDGTTGSGNGAGTTEGSGTPDGAGDAVADAAAPSADPTPSGFAPIDGFVAVPLDVTVLGPTPAVVDYLDRLQRGEPRPFLVTELRGTGQAESGASGGRPTTADGDLELTISGYVYVLTGAPVGTAVTGTEPPAERPALPTPDGSRRPYTGA